MKKGQHIIQIVKLCGNSFYKGFYKLAFLKIVNSFLELLGLTLLFSSITILINEKTLTAYLLKVNEYTNLELSKNEAVIGFLLLNILFFTLKNTISYFSELKSLNYTSKVITALNKKLVHNYYDRGYWFIKEQRMFNLTHKVGSMPIEFGFQVLKAVWQLFSEISLLVFFIILSAYSSFVFSMLLLLSAIPASIFILRKIQSKTKAVGRARNRQHPKTNKELFDLFTGYIELKIYGSIDQFTNLYLKSVNKLNQIRTKQNSLNLLPKRFLEMMAVIMIVAIFLLHLLWQNMGYESNFLLDFGLLGLFGYKVMPGISRIVESFISLGNSANTIRTLYQNLNFKNDTEKDLSAVSHFQELELKDVSHSFTGKKVLKKVSLNIKKGEIIGIMGNSGSGKSTLAKAIMGLLKPESGTFSIDQNIFEPHLNDNWHRLFGYIGSELLLLDGTIYENVAFKKGDSNYDIDRIKWALKECQLHNFIDENPQIGEMGNKLSSGLKQRLALARALYHKPEILILDEFSSNLDYDNEDALLLLIKKVSVEYNTMVLIISHRPRTMRIAQKVYNIKGGKLSPLELVE